MTVTVLQTTGLAMSFGALTIFRGLDFDLRAGERHAVIGPNGAGKSTFVNLLSGLMKPSAGRLLFAGRDITRASVAERVRGGLVRSFQINSLFPALTPLQSMVLALAERDRRVRPSWRGVQRLQAQIDEAAALLQRFGLSAAALIRTERLAYGEQRLLEVALAVALKPRVLLLDEPAAGLTSAQGAALFERVSELASGAAVLFIEHDMNLVFSHADRVSVLAGGELIASGSPAAVRGDARVREAYLG